MVQFEGNPCDEANYCLAGFSLVLQAFRLFWALGTQIHHLSFSTPKLGLSTLQNTTTIKLGKKRQKSIPNMTGQRFHRTMEMIPPPAPGSLKALLFPPLLNNVENKGTQGVRARYGAELPPFISIVRYPGRPVVLGMEKVQMGPFSRMTTGKSATNPNKFREICPKLEPGLLIDVRPVDGLQSPLC